MIPYIAAAAVGAIVASRNGPRTKLKKMQCLGPRSGTIYDVDLVPNLGIIIVHGPMGASAVFQQKPGAGAGFMLVRGQGSVEVMNMMKRDLEP